MRFILVAITVLFSGVTSAQIKVEMSEMVELMAVLSRTAEFREYCMDMGGKYTEDTEAWFSPFKNHPTVAYYQTLRSKFGIGYDAVMTMAINLSIDGNKIKTIADPCNLGSRWEKVEIDTFLVRLYQFYADTRFREFYKQHQDFYEEVLRNYEDSVMAYFHQNWYASFYGTEPTERFRIIIGFTNGGGNYGPSRQLPGQPIEAFAICGYSVDEKTGKAFENGLDFAATLIHEFNHSFVNRLLDDETNKNMLEPLGKRLLKHSYRAMNSQAYRNAQTVINESIVRAAVILYMKDNGFAVEQIKEEMDEQISRGFDWMPELVATLHDYSSQRNKYKTLNAYYPQIAKVLKRYIDKEDERVGKVLWRKF